MLLLCIAWNGVSLRIQSECGKIRTRKLFFFWPEKLRIRTIFTQRWCEMHLVFSWRVCSVCKFSIVSSNLSLDSPWSYIQKQPPEVFFKIGVLKNFTKFSGKHLRQILFLNKVAGLRPEHLRWLLLYIHCKFSHFI